MTDQAKQKLKYWLIGLFTGGAVAAPVTAFVVKSICDKKIESATEAAETRGMNAMAEYAVAQQKQESISNDKVMKEEDYAVAEENDIRSYDLSIDEEEAEAERTETLERYHDMIDKYNGNGEIPPYIISAEQFSDEQFMEKSFVNWYEEDDIFEEELSKISDPLKTFGVTSGRELFKNADLRHDPDICYVRNVENSVDFEISRIHGSYAKMVGGESSLGETDT